MKSVNITRVVVPNTESSGGGSTITPSPAKDTAVEVLVNGKAENAGTSVTSTVDGKSQTIITIDETKLQERLNTEGQNAIITIPVNTSSDVVIGELNGQKPPDLK